MAEAWSPEFLSQVTATSSPDLAALALAIAAHPPPVSTEATTSASTSATTSSRIVKKKALAAKGKTFSSAFNASAGNGDIVVTGAIGAGEVAHPPYANQFASEPLYAFGDDAAGRVSLPSGSGSADVRRGGKGKAVQDVYTPPFDTTASAIDLSHLDPFNNAPSSLGYTPEMLRSTASQVLGDSLTASLPRPITSEQHHEDYGSEEDLAGPSHPTRKNRAKRRAPGDSPPPAASKKRRKKAAECRGGSAQPLEQAADPMSPLSGPSLSTLGTATLGVPVLEDKAARMKRKGPGYRPRKPDWPTIFLEADDDDEEQQAERKALLKKAMDPFVASSSSEDCMALTLPLPFALKRTYSKGILKGIRTNYEFYLKAYSALNDELTKVQIEESVLSSVRAQIYETSNERAQHARNAARVLSEEQS